MARKGMRGKKTSSMMINTGGGFNKKVVGVNSTKMPSGRPMTKKREGPKLGRGGQ